MLGFAQARQVRVNGGNDRALVAQINLDLTQVFPLLQQMGRVGVAQRMNVRPLGDAAGFEREAEGPLQRGAAHRFGSGARPQTAVTFGGKEPGRMPVRFPLFAQEQQCAFGQGDVTVLIAFAGADVQQHALRIDVGNLEAQPFTQAEAAGVDRDQADAMIQGGNAGQNAAHLGGGEHDGQFELGIGARQLQFVRPETVERFFPEQLDGTNRLSAGLAGDFLVALEMNAVLAEVLGREQVGGFAVKLTELADTGVIGLLRAWADGQELQIIGVGF